MTMNILAQDSKFSATLSYPLTVGDNFLDEYSGYVDLGLQYRFINLSIVNVGVSANATFLGISNSSNEIEKANGLLIYPRLFGEFLLGAKGNLRPQLGIGYGYNQLKSTADTTGLGPTEDKRSHGGLIVNLGLSYDISKKIFLMVQYDWAEIDRQKAVNNQRFNNRGNLVKFGLGYRF